MATKPGGFFTFSTNLNFSVGPAIGQPTKVAIPIPADGFTPGEDTIPEYLNFYMAVLGDYTVWLEAGSFAGAADAHLVETDANGDTSIKVLTNTRVDCDDSAGSNGRIQLNHATDAGAILDMSDPNGNLVAIRKTGDDGLPLQIFVGEAQSGTGINDGARVEIDGGPGQAQAGAVDNNDGGNVATKGGPPGTGGSGQAGAYGWRELSISHTPGSFGLTGHFDTVFSFQVDASTAEARQLPKVWGTNQSHWLKVRLVGRTSGGAKRFAEERNWIVRTDGAGVTTFTALGSNPLHQDSFGWTTPPTLALGSPAVGYVEVRVTENDGDDYRCSVYVEVTSGPAF